MARKERAQGRRERDALWYDLCGLLAVLGGILAIISMKFTAATGPVGQALKQSIRFLFGDGGWALGVAAIGLGMGMIWRHQGFAGGRRWAGAVGLLLLWTAAVHGWALSGHLFPADDWTAPRQGMGGGVAGYVVWTALRRAFGPAGMWLVLGAAALASTILMFNVTLRTALGTAGRFWRVVRRATAWVGRFLRRLFFVDEVAQGAEEAITVGQWEESTEQEREGMASGGGAPAISGACGPSDATGVCGRPVPPAQPGQPVPPAQPSVPLATPLGATCTEPPGAVVPERPAASRAKARSGRAGPQQLTLDDQLYQLPPVDILARVPRQKLARGDREIADKARLIEETLASFGVEAKVVEVSRGPAVTRFEVHPGPGVKVSRITALADDIALSLAAADVRIEPRIPGKSAVGIEVPNREIATVGLREVIECAEFARSESPLTVALGKDIAGRPVVPKLDTLLHVLIAGATGSGKSVCLNAIICSILYKARPHEVKFLLIDPKVVELSVFQGIPHLLAPVVADPRKATGVLRWVVEEMVQRWRLFADAGVRDITRFNQAMVNEGNPAGALPYIVVVIDELADLMTVAPAELEEAVQRLAQMGRAAGIHLVMATQRPSADVVTGTIKANIPSRVAFAVSSLVDSRIVLDMSGAERLVGRGDMLFLPLGASKPIRAQGAYVSEEEIEELVRHCASQAEPKFDPRVTEVEATGSVQQTEDEMLPQAVRVVVEARQASASLLQRRLRVGYTRAARLIDIMEARGFISAYDGTRPREVFLSMEEYRRLFVDGE